MSAAEALRAALAVGVRVMADDESLVLMRPGRDGWTTEDWLAFFDERTAIVQFDGGLSRAQANAQALEYCVMVPGRCLGCGGGNRRGDSLLPFGIETSGHAWLHGTCWPEWHQLRRAQAIAALRAMDIQA